MSIFIDKMNDGDILLESWGDQIIIPKEELKEFIEDLKEYLED